jgi:putative membrane protein
MLRFILRALVPALGLWVAARLHIIHVEGWPTLIVAGLLLGLVNACVRPVVTFLTLPITIVTLGLFLLVVNGLMLYVVSWVVHILPLHGTFVIGKLFWNAIEATIIIWLVSLVAHAVIGGDERARRR